MKISGVTVHAQVGCAEVHAALGKLAAGAGDTAAATQHLQQSMSLYEQSLRNPANLGGFAARCDVRYVCMPHVPNLTVAPVDSSGAAVPGTLSFHNVRSLAT